MSRLKILQKIKNTRKQILYIVAVMVIAVSTTPVAFATPTFSNYPISSSYSVGAAGQTTVAGGSLWYLETKYVSGAYHIDIGSMTTSGTVTDYDMSSLTGIAGFSTHALTTGPDGNVWFNGVGSGGGISTGKLDISTGSVTLYPTSPSSFPLGGGVSNIGSIVSGSDGNLWYYARDNGGYDTYLIKLNPTTGVPTVVRTYASIVIDGITSNPTKGSIWLIDRDNKRLYGINIAPGAWSGTYTIPNAATTDYPRDITSDRDGNIWFTANAASGYKFYKLSQSGTFTEYATTYSGRLVAGPDGAMWFGHNISSGLAAISRMDRFGNITDYAVPGTSISDVGSLAFGPDDALWYTYKDSGGAKMGRLVVTPDFSSYPLSSIYTAMSAGQGQTTVAGSSLWYLETKYISSLGYYCNSIGNMTTLGTTTDYDMQALTGITGFSVQSLTTGPDGNIWFSGIASGGLSVGYLDIATGSVTLYAASPTGYPVSGSIGDIVPGSDGNLWYYARSNGGYDTYLIKLNPTTGTRTAARIYGSTVLSSITGNPTKGSVWIANRDSRRIEGINVSSGAWSGSYSMPSGTSDPGNLAADKDGNIWFTANDPSGGTRSYYKLKPDGSFTVYPISPYPGTAVAAPDNAMWFISGTNKLGRLDRFGNITNYTAPGTSVSNLGGLTFGPDDALWYTYKDSSGVKMGRLGY